MKILSLYMSMPSTVSLTVDNKVVAAISEERFTRSKNDEVFPKESIDYCLKYAGLESDDLDYVAIASFISSMEDIIVKRSQWNIQDYVYEQKKRWKPFLVEKKVTSPASALDIFPDKIDDSQYPGDYLKNIINKKGAQVDTELRRKVLADYLKIDINKVIYIDHHKAHAFYSYIASDMMGKDVLALTVDGWGDGMNATINTFDKKGFFKRHYHTDQCHIARIYRYVTLLLGMKPNEHEYKVMGLAPYGKEKYAKGAYEVFKETLQVEGTEFKWKIKPTDSYYWFKERLEGYRFDSIAWALQKWTENLLIKWTENCIEKYKIKNIILSGGVAMNIKAMGKISELNSVNDIFVGGTASDESLSVSAGACLIYDKLEKEGKGIKTFSKIQNLYLGPEASKDDEEKIIEKLDKSKFEVSTEIKSGVIADLLSKGLVIGRCAERMEFGQRALGNRSILADPRNYLMREKINRAIKNRDFWMPFAPIVLDKYANEYLINPKNIKSPYMTIGFQTTNKGYEKMISACHPADKSARPQILEKKHNSKLYEIILEFGKKTDCYAVLNTSFNLHGFPIVNTPKDAFFVFENSGLDVLLLNNFIIKKIII